MDVSSVTNMKEALENTIINDNITDWNVSSVANMHRMFRDTTFDQDISTWDVSSVTDMSDMFNGSTFNQDISAWDVSKVTDFEDMFTGASLSEANQCAIAIAWEWSNLEANDAGINGTTSGFDIASCNAIPTLTTFTTFIDTTTEDTEVELTFAELTAQGDEADVDGTVEAFIVQAVSTGTLKIGTSSATASSFNASSNNEINATNNAYWTPALNANGTLNSFTVKAQDDGGKKSDTAVQTTVSVTAVNDAPTSSNLNFTIDEDTNKTFSASDFNFTDVDTGDLLETVIISTLPSIGRLTLNDNNVTLNQSIDRVDITSLVFSPLANENGSPYDSFGFIVNDGELNSSSEYNATIHVTAIDDAPVLNPIADINSIEDATDFNVTLVATDEENNPISYSATSSNNNIATVDIVNGVLVVSQGTNEFGSVTITVNATANGISTVQTFTVNISSVNDAPVIESTLDDITINTTTSFTLALKVNDNEGDDLEVDVSVNNNTFVKLNPQWTNSLQQAEYDGVALNLTIDAIVQSTESTVTVTVRVKDAEFTTSKSFTIRLITRDLEAAIEAENRRKFINILPPILYIILSDTPASED
jgi:hypothetical protein